MAKKSDDDLRPFDTPELGLAAYLQASGIHPSRVDRANPSRAVFHFNLTDEQFELISKWFDGTGLIPAASFHYAYNAIKRMAFED